MKESEEHLQTEAEWILKHTWQTAVSLQTPKAASELQLQCPTCMAGTECSNRKRSSHCWSVFSVGNNLKLPIVISLMAKPVEMAGDQSYSNPQATAESSTPLYDGNKRDLLTLQVTICSLIV